jgi:hypothetical protein
VEGLREILIVQLGAAKALAAFECREEVTEDIKRTITLCLRHVYVVIQWNLLIQGQD